MRTIIGKSALISDKLSLIKPSLLFYRFYRQIRPLMLQRNLAVALTSFQLADENGRKNCLLILDKGNLER